LHEDGLLLFPFAKHFLHVYGLTCLWQATVAGRHIVFWTGPSSGTKLVNKMLWKRMNQFWCQLAQVVHGHETINFGGQETKAQGQTRPRIDGLAEVSLTSLSRAACLLCNCSLFIPCC